MPALPELKCTPIKNILRCLLTVAPVMTFIGGHLSFAASNVAVPYQFQHLVVPGTIYIVPLGLNDHMDVFGYAGYPDVSNQGFVYNVQTGALEKIEPPGACFTLVTGVNNLLQAVGLYHTDCEPGSDPRGHAFFMDADGTFSGIDIPTVYYTAPQGINDSGDVTGFVFPQGSFNGRAFIMRCGKSRTGDVSCDQPTLFDVPVDGSIDTRASDVTDKGDTAGSYWYNPDGMSGHSVGFRRDKHGEFTSINYPGALSTVALGLNKKSVAGYWYVAEELGAHSFVFDGKNYATIDPDSLGCTFSIATGINEPGVVVGFCGYDQPLLPYLAIPTK